MRLEGVRSAKGGDEGSQPMRCKSGRSIARPLLLLDIDGTDVDVLRGTKLNPASNRENAESISVGKGIGSRLILEPTNSTQHLRIGANTIAVQKSESRANEIGIFANIRRCKNINLMHVSLYTNTTP